MSILLIVLIVVVVLVLLGAFARRYRARLIGRYLAGGTRRRAALNSFRPQRAPFCVAGLLRPTRLPTYIPDPAGHGARVGRSFAEQL
jgi:hypothetical protein